MSKHHDDLQLKFELLIDIQKELKQSFEILESNWKNQHELSCLNEIDQWEEDIINRIREIATKVRININEIMTKHMLDIRRRLDQLGFDIEQRQQEENYLDDDIVEIKKQLEQLNNSIKHIDGKIRINYTGTNKIDWNSLISVTIDRKAVENRFSLSEFAYEYEQNNSSEKIWKNWRKLFTNKYTMRNFQHQQSIFKRHSTLYIEPIVLTSFDSQENPSTNSDLNNTGNFQRNSYLNDESEEKKHFISLEHNQILSQGSDA